MIVKIKVRKIRVKRRLTQKQLSLMSGVSKSYISEIENDIKMPTLDIICKLARALNCKPCELFLCKKR